MRKTYSTDLSDEEWSYIEPHLPAPNAPGRPRLHTLREILDAIFYILRSGCAWRLLPNDFPPWKTIHHYFRTWRLDGTFERMHAALRKPAKIKAPVGWRGRWAGRRRSLDTRPSRLRRR